MLTVTPAGQRVVPAPPARWRRVVAVIVVALVVLVGGAGVFVGVRLARPLPVPQVQVTLPDTYTIPGTPPQLPWPGMGQATVEVEGIGSLGSSGAVRPVPIASVAKIMTAYVVLTDHPLGTDEDGPTMTVSAQEAAAYPAQVAANLSLVKVSAGEVLTERQALQALLLPSADNVAQILARWDAGSAAAFLARMNAAAAGIGMADTRYTDPSGLDKATVSTAADQVKLAERAMKVPALAQLVAMSQATIPVAGLVKNYNTLLGSDGIVGIKTGSTMAAGGCLVFAARVAVGGRTFTILGAVLGQAGPPNKILPMVLAASQKLVQAAAAAVGSYVAVRAGQLVATVRGPLGTGTALTAAGAVAVIGWPGMTFHVGTRIAMPSNVGAGVAVGALDVGGTSTSVVTTNALRPPGLVDRVRH